MADLALGIDIGGTKVAAALVNASGQVVGRERGAVAPESNVAGLASIVQVIDRLLAAYPDARSRLAGIGAGAPGSIDWRAGSLSGATNLSWRDLPLTAALRDRYGIPALLDNDVNVAAWGERCFGAGASKGTVNTPIQHLVFITVGTGIGAGFVEAGRIVRGRRSAGEI
ncbi:MAG: ROK family protein, partial [Chloroflexota bacterium]